MPVNVWLIIGGLVGLLLLKWLRNRYRSWARDGMNFNAVGHVFPLAGLSMVLLGIGAFGSDPRLDLPAALGFALKAVLWTGLAVMLLALVAILDVPMPAVLLPAWARKRAARTAVPPDPAAGLCLVDRGRTVSVTVPGFSEDWLTARSKPDGTLVAATARTALASGFCPSVTVTAWPGGPEPTTAAREPATLAGRPGVRTTSRRIIDGRDLTTWSWTTTDAGETVRLAITCASVDADAYSTTAFDIAASLTWKERHD